MLHGSIEQVRGVELQLKVTTVSSGRNIVEVAGFGVSLAVETVYP